jgi:chromosome segregation ATPase
MAEESNIAAGDEEVLHPAEVPVVDLSETEGMGTHKRMGVDGLRIEFQAIEHEIGLVRQKLAVLEDDEKDAVGRHDRTALDSAWLEHDQQLEQLRTLEVRREQAKRDLVREAELDIDRWRSKADVRVQQWREESREAFQQLNASLDQIERTLIELEERPDRHSTQRAQLLEELAALRPSDLAPDLSQPEVDWTDPTLDLEPIASRLAELTSRCRHTPMNDQTGWSAT